MPISARPGRWVGPTRASPASSLFLSLDLPPHSLQPLLLAVRAPGDAEVLAELFCGGAQQQRLDGRVQVRHLLHLDAVPQEHRRRFGRRARTGEDNARAVHELDALVDGDDLNTKGGRGCCTYAGWVWGGGGRGKTRRVRACVSAGCVVTKYRARVQGGGKQPGQSTCPATAPHPHLRHSGHPWSRPNRHRPRPLQRVDQRRLADVGVAHNPHRDGGLYPGRPRLLAAERLGAACRRGAHAPAAAAAAPAGLEGDRGEELAQVGQPPPRVVGRDQVDLIQDEHHALGGHSGEHRLLERRAPAPHGVAGVKHLQQHVRLAQHAGELLLERALVPRRRRQSPLRCAAGRGRVGLIVAGAGRGTVASGRAEDGRGREPAPLGELGLARLPAQLHPRLSSRRHVGPRRRLVCHLHVAVGVAARHLLLPVRPGVLGAAGLLALGLSAPHVDHAAASLDLLERVRHAAFRVARHGGTRTEAWSLLHFFT
eukprot:scaffold655_cov105-Isochrysis_galbana.AAC.18